MPEHDDLQAVHELSEAYRLITEQLGRVIVGQQQVIEELLVAMFARGHCLLVGVPGLAKTLLIRTLAEALSLEFRRIQFTPDLMPSDITGTEVIQEDGGTGSREFRFLKGPIFGNVILADEINRTPPKTQAALLEAMQEYQITAGGQRHQLGQPFFVLATQNPIEHEGTYPLPEAQLDRFMFNTYVDYPGRGRGVRHRAAHDGRHHGHGDADPLRPADSGVAEDRPPRAGGRSRGALRDEAGAADAAATRMTCRSSSATTSVGAPGRGPANIWCWGRRPGPCCTAASTPARTTSGPWRCPSSATASSRTSTPRPKASSPTN